MSIPVLTNKADCRCPHGGKLVFQSDCNAKSCKESLLTVADFQNATITGCPNPPNAGGPCISISSAQDLCGKQMQIKGEEAATEKIIAFTDKGMPVRVCNPGNSKVKVRPGAAVLEKAAFQQRSIASAGNSDNSLNREKRLTIESIQWNRHTGEPGDILELMVQTKGIKPGIDGRFIIYQYHSDNNHKFITEIKSKTESHINKEKKCLIKAKWIVPDIKHYNEELYFFSIHINELKATSTLLQIPNHKNYEYKIRIIKPKNDRKQYVNMEKDPLNPHYGREVTVEALITPARSNVEIHWAFENEYSYIRWKKEDKTFFEKDMDKKYQAGLEEAGIKTYSSKTNKDGIAKVNFVCSQYGGDKYVISASCDQNKRKAFSGILTVTRKLWYQISYYKKLNKLEPKDTIKAFDEVSVDLEELPEKRFDKNDHIFPISLKNRTFYPGWMFLIDESENVVVIGNHNKEIFKKIFDQDKLNPSQRSKSIHVIICDKQCDSKSRDKFVTEMIDIELSIDPKTRLSQEIRLVGEVITPHLTENKLVLSGYFFVNDRRYELKDEHIVIEKNRTDLNFIKIRCPDNALIINNKIKVKKLQLNAIESYMGESKNEHILIVYPVDWQCTISHEIGHSLGQVCDSPPNCMKNHPCIDPVHKQGTHCNYIHPKKTKKNFDEGGGECVMYYEGPVANCTHSFCIHCKPFLRYQNMNKLKNS